MGQLKDTIAVSGMAKLGEKLEKLPLEIKEKVARRSMQEAAKIGLAAIQTEVPWRTGNLYRHLRIGIRREEPQLVTYIVFVKTNGKRPAKKAANAAHSGPSEPATETVPYYWYFVEFGTSRMAANPFMLRGFTKSAENAATRARDTATALLRDVV